MKSRRALLALLLAVFLALPLLADDGDLDSTFWGDGTVALDVSADATFGGLATDPEGRMAVAYSYVPPVGAVRIPVWRSVGVDSVGGACEIDPEPSTMRDTWVNDVAFDAFGRLLALVNVRDYDLDHSKFYVVAYSFPDCALVPSYGSGGIATLPGAFYIGLYNNHRLQPMADGTVLVAGHDYDEDNGWVYRARVIQLESNGSVARTFTAPTGTFPSQTFAVDATAAPNGHVVAVARGAADFLVVDFAPDGSVAGAVTVAFDLPGGDFVDTPNSIAATEDGRVVVAGTAEGSDSGPYYTYAAVAALRWDGQGELELDAGFSDDGKLNFRFGGRAYNELEDVVVQGDDRIVVAGHAKYFASSYTRGMAVARLLPDGSLDGDFFPSEPGWRIVDFDVAPPAHDRAYRVDLQNGRVVLGGTVDITDGIDSVGVARLLNSYVFADGFENPQAPGWLWVE